MKREMFIAEIRHLGWVAYQIAVGQQYNEQMNKDQFESLLDGIRFQDEHPGSTPEQNHDNWMRMKIAQGWVYGENKDFEKKTYPDLIPFDELPEVEPRKDINDATIHRLAVELWNRINMDERAV